MACDMYGKDDTYMQNILEILGDLGTDGRIILKLILDGI
jgi:hypothetical protein